MAELRIKNMPVELRSAHIFPSSEMDAAIFLAEIPNGITSFKENLFSSKSVAKFLRGKGSKSFMNNQSSPNQCHGMWTEISGGGGTHLSLTSGGTFSYVHR